MIQRIQSLLLVIVVLLSIVFSYIPLFEFAGGEATYLMNAYKTFLSENAGEVIAKKLIFFWQL